MDAERTPLPGNRAKEAFNLHHGFLLLFRQTGFIQHLSQFVAGEDIPFQIISSGCIVMVNVGQTGGFQKLLSAFQFFCQFGEQFQCGLFLKAHPTFFVPDWREIHTAFEVSNADIGALLTCLHEEQLQQYTLAATGGAAQQDVGDSCQIYSNGASETLAQI